MSAVTRAVRLLQWPGAAHERFPDWSRRTGPRYPKSVAERFEFSRVAAWIDRSLSGFGEYEVDDRTFKTDSVAVIAPDGSEFMVTYEQWTDEPHEDHATLKADLRQWAGSRLTR